MAWRCGGARYRASRQRSATYDLPCARRDTDACNQPVASLRRRDAVRCAHSSDPRMTPRRLCHQLSFMSGIRRINDALESLSSLAMITDTKRAASDCLTATAACGARAKNKLYFSYTIGSQYSKEIRDQIARDLAMDRTESAASGERLRCADVRCTALICVCVLTAVDTSRDSTAVH